MRTPNWIRQVVPSAAVAAAVCVLGFNGEGVAQPPKTHEPFANTTSQNAEMVQLLRDISRQLKEQNELLRSGAVQVSVVELKKK